MQKHMIWETMRCGPQALQQASPYLLMLAASVCQSIRKSLAKNQMVTKLGRHRLARAERGIAAAFGELAGLDDVVQVACANGLDCAADIVHRHEQVSVFVTVPASAPPVYVGLVMPAQLNVITRFFGRPG